MFEVCGLVTDGGNHYIAALVEKWDSESKQVQRIPYSQYKFLRAQGRIIPNSDPVIFINGKHMISILYDTEEGIGVGIFCDDALQAKLFTLSELKSYVDHSVTEPTIYYSKGTEYLQNELEG